SRHRPIRTRGAADADPCARRVALHAHAGVDTLTDVTHDPGAWPLYRRDGAGRGAGGPRLELAGDRTGQTHVLHADASNPAPDAVADVPRGGCQTVRYFPDKLPIALDADGRTHVFCTS